MKSKKMFLAGLMAATLSGAASAAVPVFSDNFDAYTLGLSQTVLGANWTTLTGNVDLIGAGSPALYDVLPNGGRYVDLDGTSAGPVTAFQSTTFSVVANQQYQLTFQYAGNNRGAAADSALLTVEVGSQAAATQGLFNITSSVGWKTSTVLFTPTSNLASIRFTHFTGDNQGILLDNVSVTAVPEPSEWAMMAAGLGIVGLIARRRRQVTL